MREHVFALALGVLFCIPISMPERFKTGRMSAIFQTVITILLIIVFAVSLMRIVGNTSNPFIYFKY
jgi:hypothetical protein